MNEEIKKDCGCGDPNCTCGDNCTCTEENNCGCDCWKEKSDCGCGDTNCKCGDNCECTPEDNCGCSCNTENKDCGCGDPNCDCGDDCKCSPEDNCGCDCNTESKCDCDENDCHCKRPEGLEEKQESDDYFTHLLKLQAEFDNYRKRTDMEVSKAYKNGFNDAIVDFLPALDSFKMAKEYIQDKNTLVGIEYIEKGILATLEKMGVKTIDASGKFDPNFHQAIDTDSSADVESGYIVKECYKGFMMGDKVIRYSQVIVKK